MTIAQQLKQIGVEKGIKIGEEKGIKLGEQRGIEKGEHEATLKISRSMLKMGMSHESVLEATSLTEGELAQIRH